MILRYLPLLLLLPLLHAQDSGGADDDDTAHFSDVGKGRLSWIVEDQSTPWIGSYYFLGSSISHSTVLLSVVDSSTGKKLGECVTSGTSENKKSSEEPTWRKFVWTLYQSSLECNVTDSEPTVVDLEHSEHPRSFSVRILAMKGPRCFKDVIVQNEQPNGCPPVLKRNTFSSHNFDCGCPKSIIERWTAPGSTETSKVPPTLSSNENGQLVDANGVPFPLFSLAENETEPALTHAPNNHLAGVSQVPSSTFKFTAHACVGYECKNNGTCVLDIHSKPNCFCPEGFAGERCEISLCGQKNCKNGGFCQIENGVPVCRCPSNTVGENCETALCPNDCLNGGACELMNDIPTCHCLDGFIGPNCNVKDNCKDNSTCAVFGEGAVCATEPTSFAMISDQLVDSNYTCQCVDNDGHWTDCLSLALSRQAMTTHKPAVQPIEVEKPIVVPPMEPLPSGTAESTHNQTETAVVQPESEEEENPEQPVFPLTSPEPIEELETTTDALPSSTDLTTPEQEEEEEEAETERDPDLFTILSSSAIQTTTIPTTTTTPSTTSTTTTTTTTATTTTSTTTTTTTTTAAPAIPEGAGDEDELEGDNGFETVTQENVDREVTTKHKSLWTLPPVDENNNSVVDEEEEDKEPAESSETTENPDSVELQPGETARNSGRASWLSWAVAVIAIIVLIFLIGATSVFIVRYVRRSRRLHGKYNPAREENAVASTYAMPMTTVSKQERLI